MTAAVVAKQPSGTKGCCLDRYMIFSKTDMLQQRKGVAAAALGGNDGGGGGGGDALVWDHAGVDVASPSIHGSLSIYLYVLLERVLERGGVVL